MAETGTLMNILRNDLEDRAAPGSALDISTPKLDAQESAFIQEMSKVGNLPELRKGTVSKGTGIAAAIGDILTSFAQSARGGFRGSSKFSDKVLAKAQGEADKLNQRDLFKFQLEERGRQAVTRGELKSVRDKRDRTILEKQAKFQQESKEREQAQRSLDHLGQNELNIMMGREDATTAFTRRAGESKLEREARKIQFDESMSAQRQELQMGYVQSLAALGMEGVLTQEEMFAFSKGEATSEMQLKAGLAIGKAERAQNPEFKPIDDLFVNQFIRGEAGPDGRQGPSAVQQVAQRNLREDGIINRDAAYKDLAADVEELRMLAENTTMQPEQVERRVNDYLIRVKSTWDAMDADLRRGATSEKRAEKEKSAARERKGKERAEVRGGGVF